MTEQVEWIDRDLQRYEDEFKQRGLPSYMWPGVFHHVRDGQCTGQFLNAMFGNDLFEAINRADDTNMRLIKIWVRFLFNVLPSGCWGSPDNLKAWRKSGGLYGKNASAEATRKG